MGESLKWFLLGGLIGIVLVAALCWSFGIGGGRYGGSGSKGAIPTLAMR